jgi:hypothetical protein
MVTDDDMLMESRTIRWLKKRRWDMLLAFLLSVAANLLVWLLQTIGNPPAPPPPTRPPTIKITRIPPRIAEGQSSPSSWIAGEVNGLNDPQDYRMVIYSYTNQWYIQPTVVNPKTGITPDGKWQNYIQGGLYYAALLVKREISPPSVSQTLPTDDAITWEVETGKAALWPYAVASIVAIGLYFLTAAWIRRRKIRN